MKALERQQPVFVISGTPGAGKSSVAVALARRFRLGVHIPVDDVREWVVSGIANPVPVWTEETTRQFRLARQVAGDAALIYAEAGFAVVIDDVVLPTEGVVAYGERLAAVGPHLVLLRPSLEETLTRNRQRDNKPFNTTELEPAIRDLFVTMGQPAEEGAGWRVIDNGKLTVEETVDEILAGWSVPGDG